ncbi:MAG: hypothetical protein Q9198_001832, partial [Flavoplaca austrocitrina]
KVILLFNDSEAAQRFEDCVLYLTETPPQVRLVNKLGSISAFQETRIYSLYDQDDPDRGYHGIVYAKKSPKTYHFSQICYIYRDLDFSFLNQNASEIELQNVRAPQYISTRHKMLSRPKDSDAPPEFREVTSVFRPIQLTFSTDDDAVQFLSGLTGWRLKFYKQCAKLVATDTSHFHKPKKTYKNAEISLWEKSASEVGSLTQLLVRLAEMDRPWITAMLESSGGGLGLPSGGVAELKNLVIQQGKDLDTKHMKANYSAMITRSIRKLDVLKGDALTTPTVDNNLQQSRITSQYFDLDSQDDVAMSSPMEEKLIQELGSIVGNALGTPQTLVVIANHVATTHSQSHPAAATSNESPAGSSKSATDSRTTYSDPQPQQCSGQFNDLPAVQGIVLTPTVIELQKGPSQGEAKAAPTDYVTELNEIEKIKAEPPSIKSIAAAPLYRHSDIDHQRATSDIDELYIRNEAKAVHTTRESSSTMCTKLGSPTSSSASATGKQLPKLGQGQHVHALGSGVDVMEDSPLPSKFFGVLRGLSVANTFTF